MDINFEKQREPINSHKPLIYIFSQDSSQDSSDVDQILSKTMQDVGNDCQGILSDVVSAVLYDDGDSKVKKSSRLFTKTASVAMGSIAPTLLKGGLAATAAGLASGISSLSKNIDNFSNKEKAHNQFTIDKNKVEKILVKNGFSNWGNFVEPIHLASIPKELNFPPGHPLPSRFYVVHPLKKKNNIYIPVEKFESLLYRERESELIKFLVDLGATEISIQELSSRQVQGSINAESSVDYIGGLRGEIGGENNKSKSTDKVIKLNPKTYSPQNFDPTKYSWLSYEPEWEDMVHARLKGGCFSYSLELTLDTAFASYAQLGLTEGLLQNLGNFGAGGGFSNSRKEKKRFEVKFVDV